MVNDGFHSDNNEMRVSMAMGLFQMVGLCHGQSHRSNWMMTGGTPTTKRKARWVEVSQVVGVIPSRHPLKSGMFHEIKHLFWGILIYRNHQMERYGRHSLKIMDIYESHIHGMKYGIMMKGGSKSNWHGWIMLTDRWGPSNVHSCIATLIMLPDGPKRGVPARHGGTPKWLVCKGQSHRSIAGWWLGLPLWLRKAPYTRVSLLAPKRPTIQTVQ